MIHRRPPQLETAKYVLEELAELPQVQLTALAADLAADGGRLHVALATAIRKTAQRPEERLMHALDLMATWPDQGEVGRLIEELADEEPWATLKADLLEHTYEDYADASGRLHLGQVTDAELAELGLER